MSIKKKDPMPVMIAPYHDRERRTCIQVARTASLVKFIPLDVSLGLVVHSTSANSFDRRYKPLEGYPVEKACQLFLSYSQNIGATREALDYLGQVTNISDQEANMAIRKKQAAVDKVETAKPVAKKVADPKPTMVKKVVKTPAKPTKSAAKATKSVVKTEGKKTSAAQMFQDLIMAGKLTDDQIFAKVQAEFGLDESKRGYVKWYRNNLKKKGQNPPEAK